MAYESYLIEVTDVNQALTEINSESGGKEIVSVCYVADSGQVLMIIKDRERTFPSSGQGYHGEEEEG